MDHPTLGSTVGNNPLLLLGSAVVLGLAAKFIDQAAAFVFAPVYPGQALFHLLLASAHPGRGPQNVGAAPCFLRALLVLIVGFGACSGIFTLGGGLGNMP